MKNLNYYKKKYFLGFTVTKKKMMNLVTEIVLTKIVFILLQKLRKKTIFTKICMNYHVNFNGTRNLIPFLFRNAVMLWKIPCGIIPEYGHHGNFFSVLVLYGLTSVIFSIYICMTAYITLLRISLTLFPTTFYLS